MKKIKFLSSVSLLPLLLFSCASSLSKEGKWLTISVTVNIIAADTSTVSPFGTVMSLRYFVSDSIKNPDSFEENLSSFFTNKVKNYHYKFDRHHYYYASDDKKSYYVSLKTINDSYGTGKEIFCSKELYELLKEGVNCTLLTSSYFSFFSGRLVDYWDNIFYEISEGTPYTLIDPIFSEETRNELDKLVYALPTNQEIENLLSFNDKNNSIIFNALDDIEFNGEILERSKVKSPYRPLITGGAISKGFATKLIQEELYNEGYKYGFLNSGSSSISHISKPNYTTKKYQKITYADPRNTGFERTAALSFNIYDKANISTSGNYNLDKFYEFSYEGKKIRRHHIINPFNGESEQYHQSITLYSKTFDAGKLDAFSTALFSQSQEDILTFRKEILKKYPKNDLEIILLDLDEDQETLLVKTTSTFSSSLRLEKECQKAKVIYLE